MPVGTTKRIVACEDDEGDTLTTAPLSSLYHSSPGRVGWMLHELLDDLEAVSYTHLDVYKRQEEGQE